VTRRVVTVAHVEVAAQGDRRIAVGDGTIVTPLARDRAVVLGVDIDGVAAPDGATGSRPGPGSPDPRARALIVESRVRVLARRALLRRGRSLAGLDDLVAAVLERLAHDDLETCGCPREGETR
jgi:hypothetical protein